MEKICSFEPRLAGFSHFGSLFTKDLTILPIEVIRVFGLPDEGRFVRALSEKTRGFMDEESAS
ncbi:MAG: hypothetical protein ACREP6_04775 [Candidatus Binataceae bacterium]